jgi:hypothetical protein
MQPVDRPAPAPLSWSWSRLALGVVYAAPAAVVALSDPAKGLAMAVGVLPAAAVGLAPSRRRRGLVVLVGALAGVSMVIGASVAAHAVLAVLTIFALCVAVAVTVSVPGRRLAPVAMALGLPLVGAGLSFDSVASAASLALLIVTGSVYAWLVSLVWPERDAPERPPRQVPPRRAMLGYGVQLGLAGAASAAFGLAAGLDHPGWACTAALLVSRPRAEELHARGVGRSVSVLGGAVVACGVALAGPSDAVRALLVVLALAGAAATAGSRWYVTPFFSTVLVLSMLLVGDEADAAHWFLERVVETLVGVALALLAAWLVPRTLGPLLRRSGPGDPARRRP